MKLILVVVAIILLAGFGQAVSITVCPSGCEYQSIQSAVYAAKTNDTIVVSSGTYEESVFLTKELKFLGNDTGMGEPMVTGDLYTEGYKYSLIGFGFSSVQTEPDPESADSATIDYWIGTSERYSSYDSYQKALDAISNALKIDSRNVIALNYKGLMLSAQGRTVEAMEYYKRALAIDQSYDSAWVNMGSRLYSDSSDYEKALACFDNATKANPRSASAFTWKSLTLTRLGKYEDALTAINESIALAPQDDKNWEMKSILLLKIGKYDDALASINVSIELSPETASYWKTKGTILQKMGGNHKSEATEALAHAKELGI
ncbi:MAG: tetratricopeptide repeat protein [Methanothrix sp.]|nr:tetratricopeptide repeat protein [Methanothrix sp.]